MSWIMVKNIKGTSGKKPPKGYDSWLDFWKNNKTSLLLSPNPRGFFGTLYKGDYQFKPGSLGTENAIPF